MTVIKPPLDLLPDKLSRLSVLSASIGNPHPRSQLSRGFSAGSPAWGTARFGDMHTKMATSMPGLDLLVQSHSPVPGPLKQPLCLAKPVVEGTGWLHKPPGSACLHGCKSPHEACGLWAPAPSLLPRTKICSEHQPPSNLPPASSAPPSRSRALGSCAAMSMAGAEHLWKRGDIPRSQGGNGEDQPLPDCHVHLLTLKPNSELSESPNGLQCQLLMDSPP